MNYELRTRKICFIFGFLVLLILPFFAVQAQTSSLFSSPPVIDSQSGLPDVDSFPGSLQTQEQTLPIAGESSPAFETSTFSNQMDSFRDRLTDYESQNYLTQSTYDKQISDINSMKQQLDYAYGYATETKNETLKANIQSLQTRIGGTESKLNNLAGKLGLNAASPVSTNTSASTDKKSELPGKDLTARDVYCIMVRLMNWTFTIAVILAIIMMIAVGVRYVTASSGGKVDAVSETTRSLKYVFLGIVIIFLAWSLVRGTAVIISVGAPEFPTCPSSQLVPSDTTKIQDVFPK